MNHLYLEIHTSALIFATSSVIFCSVDRGTGALQMKVHNDDISIIWSIQMKKILATSIALAALVTPAFAAEFYVAQDAATKACQVSEAKPDGTTLMQRGTAAYATKEEAEAAMKADAECKQ
jgi:hypothetical protein